MENKIRRFVCDRKPLGRFAAAATTAQWVIYLEACSGLADLLETGRHPRLGAGAVDSTSTLGRPDVGCCPLHTIRLAGGSSYDRLTNSRSPITGGHPCRCDAVLHREPGKADPSFRLHQLADHSHGAGAGMTHPFLETVAQGLANRRVATLRYQFPSMEGGSRRPDKPEVAHKAVRAAVRTATDLAPGIPLFAGGKSFGGRMTSQAQAETPLPGVVGLIFLGFPLHLQGKPALTRGEHLDQIGIPMLFLQGSRDALASSLLITQVVNRLGKLAKLKMIKHADHSFHVPIKSGTTDNQVMSEMLDLLAMFVAAYCY